MPSIQHFFDQIYVLCPHEEKYRKLMMLQKLQRLQIHAKWVEGKGQISLKKLYQHILLHAQYSNHHNILILRDDVYFHKDFHQQFEAQIEHIPEDWKLLYLGAHQLEGMTGDGQPAKKLGAFAIGIHQKAFRQLLKNLENIQGTIDAIHFQQIIHKEPEACFSFQPQLLVSSLIEDFFQNPALYQHHQKALQWDISSYDFPFQAELVSVIMPAYNRAGIIRKAIASTLRQSYSALEIIVVDDASTDQTTEVVEELMKEDPRIRLVRRQVNGGVGLARNDAIRHAQGRFIAFHDSDDLMFRDRLVKQLLPFYEQAVLFTLARVIRSYCEMEELQMDLEYYNLELARSRTRTHAYGWPPGHDRERIYPATIIFRREVFSRWGLYWDLRYAEDAEMIERILYHQVGVHFAGREETALQYIENLGFIPRTVAVIPEVLAIASQCHEDNLIIEYLEKQDKIQAIKKEYRDRLLGKGSYEYPQLESASDSALTEWKAIDSLPLFFSHEANEGKPKTVQALGLEDYFRLEKEIEELKKQYIAIQKSLSWRLTLPLRFLGKLFTKK